MPAARSRTGSCPDPTAVHSAESDGGRDGSRRTTALLTGVHTVDNSGEAAPGAGTTCLQDVETVSSRDPENRAVMFCAPRALHTSPVRGGRGGAFRPQLSTVCAHGSGFRARMPIDPPVGKCVGCPGHRGSPQPGPPVWGAFAFPLPLVR